MAKHSGIIIHGKAIEKMDRAELITTIKELDGWIAKLYKMMSAVKKVWP